MEKKRVLWLDIAKALGILVVLLVHTGKSFGPVSFFGGMFYMPIFFILAGMTFRYKPEERFGSFVKKKAKRLLVPYFGYNLFLFLFFFLKNDLLAGQVSAESFFPLLGILYSRNCLFPMDSPANVYFMQILNAPTWFLTGMFVSSFLACDEGGGRKAEKGGLPEFWSASLSGAGPLSLPGASALESGLRPLCGLLPSVRKGPV